MRRMVFVLLSPALASLLPRAGVPFNHPRTIPGQDENTTHIYTCYIVCCLLAILPVRLVTAELDDSVRFRVTDPPYLLR